MPWDQKTQTWYPPAPHLDAITIDQMIKARLSTPKGEDYLKPFLGVLDSNSTQNATMTLNTAMSDGIDQTQEMATVKTTYSIDRKLATTEGFWWWTKRLQYVDLGLLEQVELDMDFQAGQAICGSVLEMSYKEPPNVRYHLRGRVPGPFPATISSEFGIVNLKDRDEAIVWILAHELCHYMKRTDQLPGDNDEQSACEFADNWLETFRKERQGRIASER